jgi:cytochrome c-type biogenesis protein CcmF
MAVFSFYLVFTRLNYLRSENELDSLISRESSFLFNNLILLAACLAVFWGTIFPLISETIQGEKITVGPPFFNKVNIPIGLSLLFLTGVAPLLAWRKTSARSIRRNFFLPAALGLILAVVLYVSGIRSVYPLISFSLCLFVITTILTEFYRGAMARAKTRQEHFVQALGRLILKNKRRYGGYIIHLGIVMMFVGFTGSAFNTYEYADLKEGDRLEIKDYTIVCKKLEEGENPNFIYMVAALDIFKGGKQIDTLYPEKRFYLASEQATSEVSIKSSLKEDLYIVFAGISDEEKEENVAVIQAWVNPLVIWIWIGSFTLALGALFTMLPDTRESNLKRRRRELEKLLETSFQASANKNPQEVEG